MNRISSNYESSMSNRFTSAYKREWERSAISPDDKEIIAINTAKELYRWEQTRARALGCKGAIFGDPAWNVLLDLFYHTAIGTSVSVSSAFTASGVSNSSASRLIDKLESSGFVDRYPDSCDRRRSYLRLTEISRCEIRDLLSIISGRLSGK